MQALLARLSFLPFMSRFKTTEKREKAFDLQLLDVDFFCQLSYMSAIATSGITRSGLFDYAAALPYISARYFKRAVFVARAFNHDYAEAARIVGQATKEPEVKAFLLRFSGALSSGEEIATFLLRESEVSADTYGNHYERRLETLKKWTDAYIALIMTTAIITIVSVVSMIIGNITTVVIMGMATLTIIVTIAGVWMIYRAAPREIKVHSLPIRSKEYGISRQVARLTLPLAVVSAAALLILGVDIGIVLMVAAVFLLPLGLLSKIDDNKIDKRDTDIAGFLRSLGGISQAIGATTTEAMGRLDFRALGYLREDVTLLHNRLLAGIDPKLCWGRFVGETGSEQVDRSSRIFLDAITLGGQPQAVGNSASGFAMQIALLRNKRRLIDAGIMWLTIVMHLVLSVLVVFVYQILLSFSSLMEQVMPGGASGTAALAGLPSFGVLGSGSMALQLLYFMIILIVLVLAFANATAIFATAGGHIFKLSYYLSFTLGISGAAITFVPPFVKTMFLSFA